MVHLQIGDTAPDFSGLNQDGQPVRLSDFKGQKLVLYFYPKDDTPGCTAEACDIRDNYQALLRKGYTILGVSPDSSEKHRRFIAKYQLPFSLIADPDKQIAKIYGVYGKKSFWLFSIDRTQRTTFIINELGKITDIITNVVSRDHAQQLLDAKA